jgi:glycine dehydrogenase subunit 1
MPYFLNNADDQEAMLKSIGADSIDDLFTMVPQELRLGRALRVSPALGELELTAHMSDMAAKNDAAGSGICFLGGGSYDHFIPAVVDAIATRSEFVTSYTPYQPEVSQGNLQALFEYQTLVSQLTGMDFSNSSLYDGGSAAAEAVLMAMSVSRRPGRVLIARSVNPDYRQILATYLANLDVELVTLDTPGGTLDPETLRAAINDQTACLLLQQPNFFGCVEKIETLAKICHEAGASLVTSVDPISLGLLKRPGDAGADIVIAEGQSLGTPMQFGGPYLGILACREKFLRRMPGRLVGQSVDRDGKRCWVLTLQTREQHIRRDKATSNICTNQALLAVRAAIYLATMGPTGLAEVANLCLQKANYAAKRLTASGRLQLAFPAPKFKEFVVRVTDGRVDELLAKARAAGIFAGLPLGRWYPELKDCLLVAVTEKRTKAEIDKLAELVGEPARGARQPNPAPKQKQKA